ncbi:hypothetical protein Z043_122932, partial [Scleropages formosus]
MWMSARLSQDSARRASASTWWAPTSAGASLVIGRMRPHRSARTWMSAQRFHKCVTEGGASTHQGATPASALPGSCSPQTKSNAL